MWWLGSVLSGAALIILSRWALRVARPAEDMQMVERACANIATWLADGWSILWRAYGPITEQTRAAWERLRVRYQTGDYGTEGT